MNRMLNGLYIVATPIGNMEDISNGAIETLKNTDFIICENPNHSRKLMSKLGIKKKLVALHDHNEEEIIKNYIEKIKSRPVALISDSGSPLISDPGYKLVRHCIKEKILLQLSQEPHQLYLLFSYQDYQLMSLFLLVLLKKIKKNY